MGIYSGNRTSLYESSMYTAIDESYANSYGVFQMMHDAELNDQSLFESVITSDFVEATAATLDEAVVMEAEEKKGNFIKTIWNKICELCKKIKEKVAGVIEAFKNKINEFKKKQLDKKITEAKKHLGSERLPKRKIKVAYDNHMFSDAMNNKLDSFASEQIDEIKKTIDKVYNLNDKDDIFEAENDLKINQFAKKNGSSKSAAVKLMISDVLQFSIPEVHEHNMSKEMVEDAIAFANSDVIKNLNSLKKKSDAELNKIASDAKKKVNEAKKNKDDDREVELAKANTAMRVVNSLQQIVSVLLQEEIKIATNMLKIASKIISTAADKSFAEGAYYEDNTLLDAIGESAENDVDLCFESYDLELAL